MGNKAAIVPTKLPLLLLLLVLLLLVLLLLLLLVLTLPLLVGEYDDPALGVRVFGGEGDASVLLLGRVIVPAGEGELEEGGVPVGLSLIT